MSNNLSKLLVPSRIDLLVERALGIHQLVEGPVLDDVPLIQVDDVVGRLHAAGAANLVQTGGFFLFLRERSASSRRPVPDV